MSLNTQSGVQESSKSRRCWICFAAQTDTEANDVWVKPCKCTLEAHQHCLNSWVNYSRKPICPQCGTKYAIDSPSLGLPLLLAWAIDNYTLVVSSVLACSTVFTQTLQWLSRYGHLASVFVGATEYDRRYFETFDMTALPPFFIEYYNIRSAYIPICLLESNLSNRNLYIPIIVPLLFETRAWTLNSPATITATIPFLRHIYSNLKLKLVSDIEKAWDLELGSHYVFSHLTEQFFGNTRRRREGLRWGPIDINIVRANDEEFQAVVAQLADNDVIMDDLDFGREERQNLAQQDINNDEIDNNNDRDMEAVNAGLVLQSFVLTTLTKIRDAMTALTFPLICGLTGQSILNSKLGRNMPLNKYHWSVFSGCCIILSKDIMRLAYKYLQVRHNRSKRFKNYDQILARSETT